jgi:hypothetical protein
MASTKPERESWRTGFKDDSGLGNAELPTRPIVFFVLMEENRLMRMKRTASAGALLVGLCLLPGIAHAIDCSGLPTSFTGNEFPKGNFFSNFDNPCYTISLASGHGSAEWGDLNATYFQAYFKVDPRYQLIVLGTFPNSRYFSVVLYDSHFGFAQSNEDANIVPLTPQYINPYRPGVAFVPGQQFAVPIGFGGTPGNLETGCKMNGYNVDVNGLDGTQRHPGMDWNSDAGLFQAHPNFPLHVVDTPQHTNPNTAGGVMIRAYLDVTQMSYQTNPHIIVRDVASGCAYPAAYALNTLQIVTPSLNTARPWLDQSQIQAHHYYDTDFLPKLCYGHGVSPNSLTWRRMPQYTPGSASTSAYIVASVPSGLPATLAAAGEVMRIRVRVPATPPTPCTNGCSRSGVEQMRYASLSFVVSGGIPIASLADSAFTKDPNGYATLIVGTGATIPSWIAPANGYTFLDLTSLTNYQQLSLLDLRHITPAGGFDCAGQFVPYRTVASTPTGSLMGDYMPVVDYPSAASLPQKASPLVGPNGCAVFPVGDPGIAPNCGVFPSPPPVISAVATECPAPGCNQFVAQPTPPVTIIGAGFGVFPNGIPLTGTSNYLQITDKTQNWSAGYTGSACSVSISSWDRNRIQFVANVNQNGMCPLAVGDQLTVKVCNPETMAATTSGVTVAAN